MIARPSLRQHKNSLQQVLLQFLVVELQEHHSGAKPLILLEDVFSELDATREQKLMESLQGYQTIITATDLRDELKTDAAIMRL